MPVYGATQIYLKSVAGTLDRAQMEARVAESRGFEVLSVSHMAIHYSGSNADEVTYLLTMRASRTLFVSFSLYPESAPAQHYQIGPYDGDFRANNAAEIMPRLYPGAENVFVTAQREHLRTFIESGND